jgi:hypothetical protein
MVPQAAIPLVIQFSGDVFTLYVSLEGQEVAMHFDGATGWQRSFESFSVHGDIEVICTAKGFSQAQCTLVLRSGSNELASFSGMTGPNGVWHVATSVPTASSPAVNLPPA